MPANSGALTGTIAHKHSALSADGGFLDDGVTGVTGTANGSLVMFDGSSIAQDLPAGNLNDVLTMGAAVPAWSPASGGGAALELVAYSELVADANDITITINPPIAADDCPELILVSQGGTQLYELNLQVNGVTTTDYQALVTRNFAGTLTGIYHQGPPYNRWSLKEGTTPVDPYYLHATITCGGTTASLAADQRVHVQSVSCTSNTSQCNYGELLVNSITSIDEIKIFTYGVNRMRAGTYLAVYKRNNS